ncbi:hypothetical protein [Streptomyces sp. NPDC049879]|uniref:hypothetical protein n=1 Tax=Streptomyces sp. NPDC049879 TaxID=3365598 RepID=UPI0037B7FF34
MSQASFTRADVEEKLGNLVESPWQTRKDFLAEIDTADMELQATSFRRASGEAAEAGGLGRAATGKATEAGQADGESLVDGDERVASTSGGLQDDGAQMEQVSRLVFLSRDRALETADGLTVRVDALDSVFESELAYAEETWADWRSLVERTPTGSRLSYGHFFLEWSKEVSDSAPAASFAKHLKNEGIEHVRVEADGAAHDAVELLAAYRHDLTGLGQELIELGYDIAGSPLGLWTSEAMLDYAVDAINAAEPGDEDAIRPHLAVVEGLIAATEDGRKLTWGESHYLSVFLNRLDEGKLVDISEHAVDTSSLYPGMPGWGSVSGTERTSADVLADAVMVLNDPARHESRRDFVDAPNEVGLLNPRTYGEDDIRRDPGADDGPEYLEDYDAMTQFLARSDILPGEQMAERMTESALYTQELYTQHEEYRGGVQNPGANRLLELAAKNPDSAAGMLADENFTQRLFDQKWEDSSGAAAFVTAGTTYPEDVRADQRGSMDYSEARTNVGLVGWNDYDAVRDGRGETPEDMDLDHLALEFAVRPLIPQLDNQPMT